MLDKQRIETDQGASLVLHLLQKLDLHRLQGRYTVRSKLGTHFSQKLEWEGNHRMIRIEHVDII